MTVLVLGGTDDAHAVHMVDYLKSKQVDAEMLDSRWFPTVMQIAWDPTRPDGTIRLPTGRLVLFSQVRSVYWRCYNSVQPPPLPDPEQSYIAANDCRGLFESLLIHLPARWVNGWRAYQLHQTKPVQLALVAALGIPVPATLLANDPEAVRSFAAKHPGSIFKPVQGGAHTRRLTVDHLDEAHLANLAFAPVTLQEEVPGTNVRVFVAGQKVMACTVQTDAVDFRDDPAAPIAAHELPDAVADQCLQAARALDLLWTGIDLRRTLEGRYVFLEANPSPMFIGFEARTGLPLTEALAGLLIE